MGCLAQNISPKSSDAEAVEVEFEEETAVNY
jgi:hypothetical protein